MSCVSNWDSLSVWKYQHRNVHLELFYKKYVLENEACSIIKKETAAQLCSFEFCKPFEKAFFELIEIANMSLKF